MSPAQEATPPRETCQACFGTGMHRRMGQNVRCPNGCPVPSADAPAPPREEMPCAKCGGWTQNADGHRDDCPNRPTPEYAPAHAEKLEATPPRECVGHPVPGRGCVFSEHETSRNGGVERCIWCGSPRAASPAQEAAPPRCPECGTEGEPVGDGRFTCPNSDCARLDPIGAAPTPEASAPERVAEYERQLRDAAEEHEDVGASFALDAFLALKHATPAAGAPGKKVLIPLADLNATADLLNDYASKVRELEAAVAALTAERTELQRQLHQQD